MWLPVTGIDVRMCDQLWVTEAEPEARTQLCGDTGVGGSDKQLNLRSWGSDGSEHQHTHEQDIQSFSSRGKIPKKSLEHRLILSNPLLVK